MKMKSLYSALLLGALTLTGCTNLDETLYDKVSMDDYGKTETEVQTIMGGAMPPCAAMAHQQMREMA